MDRLRRERPILYISQVTNIFVNANAPITKPLYLSGFSYHTSVSVIQTVYSTDSVYRQIEALPEEL